MPEAAPIAKTEAVEALGATLDSHRLVAIGESHGSARFHTFLQALLRRRDFVCRFDDIVVEFGNARLQPVADLYTSGRPVARRDNSLASLTRCASPPDSVVACCPIWT